MSHSNRMKEKIDIIGGNINYKKSHFQSPCLQIHQARCNVKLSDIYQNSLVLVLINKGYPQGGFPALPEYAQ